MLLRDAGKAAARRGGGQAVLLCLVAATSPTTPTPAQRPVVAYAIRIDPAHPDAIDVAITVRGMESSLPLAMKVHPEYDARYWRFIEDLRVEGAGAESAAGIQRESNTLWRAALPGGAGTIRYRVHVQAPAAELRRAWQTYVRADGAIVNPPDVFLYLPTHPELPATVTLDAPREWRVATALGRRGGSATYAAPGAETLLDSPILVGALRDWGFSEGGTAYHVAYWPLPGAAAFDTLALVDELRRLARAALGVFGRAPARAYWFLLEDGASDALEHRASVTIGVPSAQLARDPHSHLQEITHEFFHAWNLVAIHPVGWDALSHEPPVRTSGLWLGEGVTLHYADVLPRRAGLAAVADSRLDHLAMLLQRYYASPAIVSVSPARASLAFDDSPVANPDATGGYYLQGELLADVIDARVRAATSDRRGLDDVMRALYAAARSPRYRGYTADDVVRAADETCACRLDPVFAREVSGPGPIDVSPVVARLGLRAVVDSVVATDSAGRPAPDLRLGLDFTAPAGVLRLVVRDSTSALARAGVRTGDELLSMAGTPVSTFADMRTLMSRFRVGDTMALQLRRGGGVVDVAVPLTAYSRPRVRFVDAPVVSGAQRRRRTAWLQGE